MDPSKPPFARDVTVLFEYLKKYYTKIIILQKNEWNNTVTNIYENLTTKDNFLKYSLESRNTENTRSDILTISLLNFKFTNIQMQ